MKSVQIGVEMRKDGILKARCRLENQLVSHYMLARRRLVDCKMRKDRILEALHSERSCFSCDS
ncbi:hypothetical protein MUK42_27982 [Musa troglodytarum]|uniref:Uncharacterized protein n=1 Tax=Musa troglodytarum TaxID=320322 RepID=A0A9E7KAQ7_9LILI|nr:hypothetical protein MUK42_27982 [Musa troglodytarum]